GLADCRRKGSGFLKSTGTFLKKYCRATDSSSNSLAVRSIFRQKDFRIALALNQNFKSKLDYSS
ncbi:hypothetical protein, partial [Peribacillus frigoritolerans]|uniref:hypothetical protein n=1 Tax=Peribacillus frigoritolerans TaxID=450367 RepID=UPI0020C030B1